MKQKFWIDIHRELGCENCKFCDYEAYGITDCCIYSGELKIEDETGKCLSRKNLED